MLQADAGRRPDPYPRSGASADLGYVKTRSNYLMPALTKPFTK